LLKEKVNYLEKVKGVDNMTFLGKELDKEKLDVPLST